MNANNEIRVLAVDDEPMVLELITGRLNDTRYTVVGRALNGIQALEKTRELHPDVVLMDIEMPEMNGIEATKNITRLCPTPVVVLTAYAHAKIVEEASEAGAGAFLTKPATFSEIERAITIAMARFEDMQQLRSLNVELEKSNRKLQKALDDVETLNGLLPICASCKKIRDDKGYWNHLESYIEKHSSAQFSHGICDECSENLYGDTEWYQKLKNKRKAQE
jgi:DNA-binding NarL/FixJ family response regulator